MCNCWLVASFDFSGAYLCSPVKETVFVEPPTHFLPNLKGKVLYGRCWWYFLSGIWTHMGFTMMEVDKLLYLFRSNETIITIWIHIENGIIMSNSMEAISAFKKKLCVEVDITWHDTITQIVGLECAFGKGEVNIAPQQLTNNILDAYPQWILQNDSPLPVLLASNSMLKGDFMDLSPFWLVVGSLAYLGQTLHLPSTIFPGTQWHQKETTSLAIFSRLKSTSFFYGQGQCHSICGAKLGWEAKSSGPNWSLYSS
ncbi:hypothetical protein O181_018509 [Austropuccinia psidii MF-1]|uniref:Reverse transcriptase Ty1/copia-type domain-containing protein n=1 Tax=Austropuccinia psidii MF-1 TaxID=1389203 RepID=A0A9Q3GTU7_9BASI|nr:hypothetical protein [Austropuccinia psidii MF-1]